MTSIITQNKVKKYSKLFNIEQISSFMREETHGQIYEFFDIIIKKKDNTFSSKKITYNLKSYNDLHKIKKINDNMYFFTRKQLHNLIIKYIDTFPKLLDIDMNNTTTFINYDLLFQHEEQIYKCINLYLYNIWYHIKDVEILCPNPKNLSKLNYTIRANTSHIHCLKWTLYNKILKKYHKYAYDE